MEEDIAAVCRRGGCRKRTILGNGPVWGKGQPDAYLRRTAVPIWMNSEQTVLRVFLTGPGVKQPAQRMPCRPNLVARNIGPADTGWENMVALCAVSCGQVIVAAMPRFCRAGAGDSR